MKWEASGPAGVEAWSASTRGEEVGSLSVRVDPRDACTSPSGGRPAFPTRSTECPCPSSCAVSGARTGAPTNSTQPSTTVAGMASHGDSLSRDMEHTSRSSAQSPNEPISGIAPRSSTSCSPRPRNTHRARSTVTRAPSHRRPSRRVPRRHPRATTNGEAKHPSAYAPQSTMVSWQSAPPVRTSSMRSGRLFSESEQPHGAGLLCPPHDGCTRR